MDNLQYIINFKRIALANKITVQDATGATVSYSHQKLLKLKEKVLLFSDESQNEQIAEINADSVIDFNVKYTLTDQSNQPVYTLTRVGKKSLWKANYQISNPVGDVVLEINEKSSWIKVFDTLFSEIPFVGILAGYIFHVEYLMTDPSGNLFFTIKKKPALLESSFEIYAETNKSMDLSILQITLMAVMRERFRS